MKISSNKLIVGSFALAVVFGFFGLVRAANTVGLGAADDFSILAGSSIVDTNLSNITSGNVGLSPTTGASIGLTDPEVAGIIYAVDAFGPSGSTNDPVLLTLAKGALDTAFIAAGQITTGVISANLGGQTLVPGVYEDNNAPDSLSITGILPLILDAGGDPNAVFIFKTGSTLVTGANSQISLINGAQACNVFWQVGSSATLGTNTSFKGTILAFASITDNGGSTIEGRFLARNGSVTLNNTTITKPTCALPPGSVFSTSTSRGGVPPLIEVLKTPNPITLPAGGGSVVYTYKVRNIGAVPMKRILLLDNKCSAQEMRFISSDRNSSLVSPDASIWMAVGETWTYTCASNLTQTTQNIATVTGYANEIYAVDTAVAIVTVGLSLPPPLIHVVKTPSVFILPASGGAVTYTYTVTNPGVPPLSNVSIVDDKCTGLPGRVSGHPGDINKNDLLESNESWTFTCRTNLTQTTTNTATAEGHANGLTAIDHALATVAVPQALGVTYPGLPNAGIPPAGDNIFRNTIISLGALVLIGVSLAFVPKKK